MPSPSQPDGHLPTSPTQSLTFWALTTPGKHEIRRSHKKAVGGKRQKRPGQGDAPEMVASSGDVFRHCGGGGRGGKHSNVRPRKRARSSAVKRIQTAPRLRVGPPQGRGQGRRGVWMPLLSRARRWKGHRYARHPSQDLRRMQTADWALFTRTDKASNSRISFEDLVSSFRDQVEI